jgi:hypothetical protein
LSIRQKLAKLRAETATETQTVSQIKIPLIKTFEGEQVEHNNTLHAIISDNKEELRDNGVNVMSVADKTKANKKILLIILATLFLLTAVVVGYFYYKHVNRPLPVVVPQIKKYFIGDVWKSVNKDTLLKESTNEATSTEDIIIINISSFEKLYPYLLKNEDKFEGLAQDNFKYTNLGQFQDATIENIDMRIADCNEGPIVYGYVNKDKLLISNDIGKYIKTYKSLKK